MKPCNCDSAKAMPSLQQYLLWLQAEVVKHARALGVPMSPNPMDAPSGTETAALGSGGTGGDGKSAGWGNGTWP